jgi:hypothetical protein
MGTTPRPGMLIGVLMDPAANNGRVTATGVIAEVWSESGDHWIVSYVMPGHSADFPDVARSALLHPDLHRAQSYIRRLTAFAAPGSDPAAREDLFAQFARAGGHTFQLP